ncbi:hypothetical protein M426DRAFT_7006 [Hypoxylon sp. CI-4A]|nr:hypothetical protein M426DRAFT_7006 [Hypoxylon sp. CI-4A]
MRFTPLTTTTLLAAAAAATQAATTACFEQAPSALGFPINFDITPTRPNAISFLVGAEHTGPCTLVAKFPAGYPITSTGSDLVNVTALDGPAQGALVGALRFRADGTTTVINSFVCADVMAYELAIAQGEGEVRFSEIQGAGLFMEVGDCF